MDKDLDSCSIDELRQEYDDLLVKGNALGCRFNRHPDVQSLQDIPTDREWLVDLIVRMATSVVQRLARKYF